MTKTVKTIRSKCKSDDTSDSLTETIKTEITGVEGSKAKKAKTDAGSRILYTLMVTEDELPSTLTPPTLGASKFFSTEPKSKETLIIYPCCFCTFLDAHNTTPHGFSNATSSSDSFSSTDDGFFYDTAYF